MIKLNSILNEIKINQPASSLITNLRKAIRTDLHYYIDSDNIIYIDFDVLADLLYDVFEKTYNHAYDDDNNNSTDTTNWDALWSLFHYEAEKIFSEKYGNPITLQIEY